MKLDHKKILPQRYQEVSYETDVSEAIKQAFVNQIRKRDGLYLFGESGVGKTHVACALAKNLLENGIEVKFYNTGDFLEKLREEFERPAEDEDEEYYVGLFREIMNFKGVLIFDDLGAEKISDWARERLYLIINKKYDDMIPMIFTSNCDMEILSARMGDRIASRILGMTLLVEVDGGDNRLESNMKIENGERNQQ